MVLLSRMQHYDFKSGGKVGAIGVTVPCVPTGVTFDKDDDGYFGADMTDKTNHLHRDCPYSAEVVVSKDGQT